MTLAVGWVRWSLDSAHANVDVFYYARIALRLAGEPGPRADVEAAQFTYRMVHPGRAGTYAPERLVISSDPRYTGIFTARAMYPLLAAPGAALVGVDSLIVTAWLGAIATAVVVALAARSITGSSLAGLVAAAALVASPGGRYLYWTLAESTMLAGSAICLAAAAHALTTRSRAAIGLALAALAFVAATKIGNADALGLVLVGIGVGAAVLDRPWRAVALRLAAGAVGLMAAVTVVSTVLGLPSALDQVQDFLTDHFAKPDHASPLVDLLVADVRFAGGSITRLLPVAGIAIVVLGAAWLLVGRWREAWSWPWLGSMAGAALLIASHPVRSELDRLALPVWLGVSIAIGVAAHEVRPRLGRLWPRRLPGVGGRP